MKKYYAYLTILIILFEVELKAQEWISYTIDCCNLKSNNITAVTIDSKGGKWFGTDKGLLHFDGKDWTNYQTAKQSNSIPSNHINDLALESSPTFDERIWVATDSGATVISSIFDELVFSTPFQKKNSDLLSNNVNTVYVDNNNVKWFGTDNGVSRFNNSEWTNFSELNYNEINHVLSLGGSADGKIYIGTKGGGVSRLIDNGIDAITSASPYDTDWSGILSDNIYMIEVNNDGTQWIGTDEGLNLHKTTLTKDGWWVYLSDVGLVNNHVQAIAKDSAGSVWIGTKEGVSFFDGQELWKSFTVEDGLRGNDIRDIAVDKDGSIWFATDKGISHYLKQ